LLSVRLKELRNGSLKHFRLDMSKKPMRLERKVYTHIFVYKSMKGKSHTTTRNVIYSSFRDERSLKTETLVSH
jgi:hypothetical protein